MNEKIISNEKTVKIIKLGWFLKLKIIFLIAFLYSVLYSPSISSNSGSAVTFIPGGGLLGDHLANYWRAKYFSYIHKIPFYCPNFRHANEFVLGKKEKKFYNAMRKNFKNVVHLRGYHKDIKLRNNTLYIISYFFLSPQGYGMHDQKFVNHMKEFIKPINSIPDAFKVTDRLNVALHIRCGNGFEGPDTRRRFPAKFPPQEFYYQALEKLLGLIENQPLHVHLFTDHAEPPKLAHEIKKALPHEDITFSYRERNEKIYVKNTLIPNTVLDLFQMAQYDFLIRPDSGYSRMAELIGNAKIILYPEKIIRVGNTLHVKKIGIMDKRNNQDPYAPYAKPIAAFQYWYKDTIEYLHMGLKPPEIKSLLKNLRSC